MRSTATAAWVAARVMVGQALTMPVLLITGRDDLNDFRVMAEILAAMVADTRRVDLPGTGHLAHLERPAETIHAITAFLGETDAHPVDFG